MRTAIICNMRQKPAKDLIALSREQQIEAAKLDAAIANNLENNGHGKQ